MCGIFAVAGSPDAPATAQLGLFALQHRGQESAGVVSVGVDGRLHARVGMGLVSEVFPGSEAAALGGLTAVGHVRYATTGASQLKNAQPLVYNTGHGPVAIAHNGNLTNALGLKKKLESRGAIFQRPFSGRPSSAAKQASESKDGQHSQSTDPSRLIRAAVRQSPTSA